MLAVTPSIDRMEPVRLQDLKKRIHVPRYEFELWLRFWDWTYHQLGRGEFPDLFIDNIPEDRRGQYTTADLLEDFQLACICADRVLWCQAFLREPEDFGHKDPYNFFDYQVESARYPGDKIHKDAAEVGKTREIVTYLHPCYTVPGGSGLIGAPLQGHIDEIIEAMDNQLTWNPDLGQARWHRRIKEGWKKHPYHSWYFRNEFNLHFRPSGHDGNAYRGLHVWTFALKDEGVKDKQVKTWAEFWRAMKPGCAAGLYSVPDGDRSCDFYKLGQGAVKTEAPKDPASLNEKLILLAFDIWKQRALGKRVIDVPDPEEIYGDAVVKKTDAEAGKEDTGPAQGLKDAEAFVQEKRFKLFHWPKSIMPEPFWSPAQRAKFRTRYKGEGTPEYKHNVLGLDGDPESSVFPWEQFKWCIKHVPEYRCMKIFVDSVNNEVIITGYRTEVGAGPEGPDPRAIGMLDTAYRMAGFFDYTINPDGTMTESEFRKIIKSFFLSAPGLKRGGADLGFSGDPTEMIVKNIIGTKERVIARLRLERVTYDQQCQALDALDDIYGPLEAMSWGTDFGNAGSAVAHDLQGLPQYRHKRYEDRLKGFMFESTTSDINKKGEEIKDGKSGEPKKITLKELGTDLMVKDMQIMDIEYPGDPDFAFFYPNHTVRSGQRHRLYKSEDDHLIDAERCEKLAGVLGAAVEDEFACGSKLR